MFWNALGASFAVGVKGCSCCLQRSGRKKELSFLRHTWVSAASEQRFLFPPLTCFFLRSASIAINKTSLKDKQFGPVWLFCRPKFRANCCPKELSAARRSSVCSVCRSFLFTSFFPLSSSPLGLSIKPYGSGVCSDVLWMCRTVTAERWACDSPATSVRAILVGEIQDA